MSSLSAGLQQVKKTVLCYEAPKMYSLDYPAGSNETETAEEREKKFSGETWCHTGNGG